MTIAASISEKELSETVVGLAMAYGWMVYGVLDTRVHARRFGKGYPDLTLVHPQRRYYFVYRAEVTEG